MLFNDTPPKKFRGTCETRCPQIEIIEREVQNNLDTLEMNENRAADHDKVVKAYREYIADNDQPLPSDVRTHKALKTTLDYHSINNKEAIPDSSDSPLDNQQYSGSPDSFMNNEQYFETRDPPTDDQQFSDSPGFFMDNQQYFETRDLPREDQQFYDSSDSFMNNEQYFETRDFPMEDQQFRDSLDFRTEDQMFAAPNMKSGPILIDSYQQEQILFEAASAKTEAAKKLAALHVRAVDETHENAIYFSNVISL